jgi:glycosyltransferase involved in cell wall biosynthesis
MIKGLWIGDAVATTGFARVNHEVIDELGDDYEIHHLGINYYGDPHPYKHFIYPASVGGDIYGIKRLEDMLNHVKPDFIFILNDVWITDIYLDHLKNLKWNKPLITYVPVDAKEHSKNYYKNFEIVTRICAYTEFGKQVIIDTGSEHVTEEKLRVVPHGSNLTKFFPVPKSAARLAIYPEDRADEFRDSFVILNANRNQPRKKVDVTMWAFRDFAKDKDDVKLYLHMGTQDVGIDIVDKAQIYDIDTKFVITSLSPNMPSVSDERLNLIYNATDVGVNSSLGEGWGLVNWEHAATGKPQIVPDYAATAEVWTQGAWKVPAKTPHMIDKISTVGYIMDTDALTEVFEEAYEDWKTGGTKLEEMGKDAMELVTDPKFSWKAVAKQFDEIIKEVL